MEEEHAATAALMEEFSEDTAHIRTIAQRLCSARTRGELGAVIAGEVQKFSLFELQRAQMFCHRHFYSMKQTVGKLLAREWLSVAVAHYARKLNRAWMKRNRTFLRVVELLKPRAGFRLSVDYREDVKLDGA